MSSAKVTIGPTHTAVVLSFRLDRCDGTASTRLATLDATFELHARCRVSRLTVNPILTVFISSQYSNKYNIAANIVQQQVYCS